MADPIDLFTPYSTARLLMGVLPTWMDEYDAERIATYQIYEQIYWSVPETFKLVSRGAENKPIYIPNARVIVDTADRYTAAGFGYRVDPMFGSTSEQATAALGFKALFDRERFLSKFHANKRMGLIRGDWAFHIVADPLKLPGARISIYTVDPAALFHVYHPDDVDKIQGIHIIEQYQDGDKTLIKRQTYSKGPDPYDPDADDGKIWSSLSIYDLEGWNTAAAKVVTKLVEPFALPDTITAFPVYHIRNQEEPGNPWGSSELRGFERIMAAVNQGISDEELALALEGLGMYATNSGPPRNADGVVTNWKLGPGRVVELEGDKGDVYFERVDGIGSVAPYQDHLKFLINSLREGSGTPNVAVGQIDVQVAESGVALAIQMSPMLSKVEIKDIGIRDTTVQMFYDLKSWLLEYEQINTGLAMIAPVFGPKLPLNVKEEVSRVIAICQAGLASPDWGRAKLAELGYMFAADEGALVLAAASATAVAADPFAARAAGELGAPPAAGL